MGNKNYKSIMNPNPNMNMGPQNPHMNMNMTTPDIKPQISNENMLYVGNLP